MCLKDLCFHFCRRRKYSFRHLTLKFVVFRSELVTLHSEQLQRLWDAGVLDAGRDHGGGGDEILDCFGWLRGGRGGGVEVVINCC
jgi:hypothetical protein